ncbi:MAG: hypothetical protein PHT27_06430 [Candidatus Izemoplasmatales bacterium]|nr:hypothetical protein [Candidatus Izemoplasmatales bacterium]
MPQEPLDLIWNCSSHNDPELTIETLKSQPENWTDTLINLNVLKPGRTSNYVVCEVCRTHMEEVFRLESPAGMARHFMICKNNGLIEVPKERLLRWNIDYAPILQALSNALKIRSSFREIIKGHLWDLGFSSLPGISRPAYVIRNIDMLQERLPVCETGALFFLFGSSSIKSLKVFEDKNIFELRNLLFLKDGAFDIKFLERGVMASSAEQIQDAPNIFRRSGDSYCVRYNGGKPFTLSTVDVGAGYIHKLLALPGKALSVAEIVLGTEIDMQDTAFSDSGDVADGKAVSEYRNRARELIQEIIEARDGGDIGRLEILQEEAFRLEKAVSESRGLKNRPRKAQSGRERIRKAFYSAYLRARKKIEDADPALGEHLKQAISGGLNPVYRPGSELVWLT